MLKHFTEVDGKVIELPESSAKFVNITQGPAILADDKAIEKDKVGFTNPNLHRRVKEDRTVGDKEYLPREYNLSIQGVDSYRTTESFIHDEESELREEP